MQPGSKASPTAPNSSTPCAPKALTSWPRVNSTPSINDSSDASSPFAASKAYPRLSETSNRLFAKPCDAKSFAAWTSRLAILRVFSCSAMARSSWSFRSFFRSRSFSARPRPHQLVPPRRRPAPAPRLLPPYQYRPSCSARASIVAYCVVPQGRVTWRCAARRALLCARTARTPSITALRVFRRASVEACVACSNALFDRESHDPHDF